MQIPEGPSSAGFRDSSQNVESLRVAYQHDRESLTQALHNAQACEKAEKLRANKAEELCKLLHQQEVENEARVAAAHEEMRRAQQSETEMIQSIRTMERSNKRLTSHSIGEEQHIQHLENLVEKLQSSLTKAKDDVATAKREARDECIRANKCEEFLQVANNQVQQGKKRILHLERSIETFKKAHVEDQRRAEFAENEYSRLSALLAAKPSGKYPGAGRSRTPSADTSNTHPIVQQLLALCDQTQELREAIDGQTSKLDQLQETGDLGSELKHVRTSADRQNAKLHSVYSWLVEAITDIQAGVQESKVSLSNETKKHHNQTKKRKVAKQNLDRQVYPF